MSMELKGKTVVITGAARGIGRALAEDFAGRGANVALIDINTDVLKDTQAACQALGVIARSYAANVADEADVIATFDRIVADFGRCDGLVNNAGIVRDALLVKAKDGAITGKMSMEQWNSVISVNLTGVFLCAREAAERMIRCGNGGVIVNISSISRAGNAGQSNYTAAKAGVAAMTVVWAKELARYGIRVGAIAPGFTRTAILDAMRPEMLDKLVAPVPLQRLGKVTEIAHAARFIFENDYYTGRTLELDGGLRL
jgi:3-oxoacyl-[acyl-carrier protein] reductase